MADLNNLPLDISPASFFALVEETMANESAPAGASPEKAQITLTGDGGGQWTMGFVDNKLSITEDSAQNPPVQATTSVDDWRALVAGSIATTIREATGDVAVDPSKLATLYKSSTLVEQIKAYPGDLQVTLTADDGNKHVFTLTFGGAAPKPDTPTANVGIQLGDLVAMLKGEMQPQEAFFMGKIEIGGDMNFVMGLFGVLMSA